MSQMSFRGSRHWAKLVWIDKITVGVKFLIGSSLHIIVHSDCRTPMQLSRVSETMVKDYTYGFYWTNPLVSRWQPATIHDLLELGSAAASKPPILRTSEVEKPINWSG